jgi:hypothetical protein
MGKQFSLTAQTKLVQGLAPAADAAGRTGDYVSMKGAHKAAIIVNVNQGNAATVQLSLVQAKDTAGTGAKAVASCAAFVNEDVSVSDALVPQGAVPSYTTGAALKSKMVVFEFTPESALDLANGYSCVAVVTGASNVANLTEATYVLGPLRYAEQTPPSAAY